MKAKKKFHVNWFYVAIAFALLGAVFAFSQYFMAISDPARFNWKLEYLQPGQPVDEYLHKGDVVIALVFYVLVSLFFVYMLLDLLFRKKSSHILAVEIGTGLVLAYEIARACYAISLGSVHIVVGLLYLGAAIGTIGTMVLFAKKALDGDHLTAYWVFFLVSALLFYFAGSSDNSYSILNAYSHNGDFSFWFGYGASRLMFIALLLSGFVNLVSDFCPELPLAVEER